MACSGCASNCMCLLTAGDNITVTGLGSALNPYVISATTGGAGLPPGGATHEALLKNSATNYDAGWVTPPQARYVFDSEMSIGAYVSADIPWDIVWYENQNFLNSPGETFLTIPTGWGGWYSINVNLRWSGTFTTASARTPRLCLSVDGGATEVACQASYVPASVVNPSGVVNLSWQGIILEGAAVVVTMNNDLSGVIDLLSTGYGGTAITIHWDSAATSVV